ncbi:MAG: alpha-glucosidase [Spirochaetaceae bacterium]|nr:MAG: alpha-glucosidase [Spirochaetaceae bacterium]
MRQAWWKEAVVYQVYTRSFKDSNGDGIGDLGGVLEKLDYIADLGVGIIWLNPIYRSPNDDNGYDISDYRQIMNEFGTMRLFDELLAAVHSRGMRLIMDLVVNHTSDEHEWFRRSRSSKESEFRDYYIWHPGKEGGLPNNWRSFFEGPAWELDPATGEYYLHLFSRRQPDLNWENERVRSEVRDIIRFWLEKGVDGFRMDVINLLSKAPGLPDGTDFSSLTGHDQFANGPRISEYMRFVKDSMSGYDVMTVGETTLADLETIAGYVNPEHGTVDMAINFEQVSLDRGQGVFDPIPLDLRAFKESFASWQRRLDGRGWNCLYLSNHDQPRQVSRFGEDGPNRSISAKTLATLLHTLQGTPFIMQGEEIGMTNVAFGGIDEYRDVATLNYYRERVAAGEDPAAILPRIHACSRDNARTPVQWSAEPYAGFGSAEPWIGVNPDYTTVNVESELADPDSVLQYYRRLIALRKEHPVIVYGDFSELTDQEIPVFAFERRLDATVLTTVLNLSTTDAVAVVPEEEDRRLLLASYADFEPRGSRIPLRPWEAAVWISES